jgi:hypothetical protein
MRGREGNSRMLMKKEDILNKHQPSSLRHGTKETIQDSRRHKALETRSCRAPDRSEEREDHEIEEHGQASEIGGEDDGCDTAGPEHEYVADLRGVYGVFGHVPYSGLVSVIPPFLCPHFSLSSTKGNKEEKEAK